MISVQTGNHEKKKKFRKKVIPKGNSFAFSMCAFLGGAIEAFSVAVYQINVSFKSLLEID